MSGRWYHWEDFKSMPEQYHIWIIPKREFTSSSQPLPKKSLANISDEDSPMPNGIHLVVEPCIYGCKELEERCEHQLQDRFILPAYYNLQTSRAMTLQCKLSTNSKEIIAQDGRLECRN